MTPTVIPVQSRFQWGPVPAVPFYLMGAATRAIPLAWSAYGVGWPESQLIFIDGRCTWFNDQRELDQFGLEAAKRLIDPADPLHQAYPSYLEVVRSLRMLEAEQVDWSALTRAELLTQLTQLSELMDAFWQRAILPELAGYGATAYLERALPGTVTTHEVQAALTTLTSADRHSFFQEEELALLALTEAGHTDGGQLERHAAAHAWLLGNYGSNAPLAVRYFQDRLTAFRRSDDAPATVIARIEERLRGTNERRRAIVAALPEGTLRSVAAQTGFFVGWHDHRKGEQLRFQLVLHQLLTAASRILSVPFDDLLYWVDDELAVALASGPLVATELVEQRRTRSLGWIRPRQPPQLITGPVAERLSNEYHASDALNHLTELRGTVASKGTRPLVRAVARILHHPADGQRLRDGEILVAAMTSPEYIDSMRRAAAIVTDVGGLTSHAAIVSRELNVPCIVGTKVATKVLKNGDMVAVDANQGIIRRLEHAELVPPKPNGRRGKVDATRGVVSKVNDAAQ